MTTAALPVAEQVRSPRLRELRLGELSQVRVSLAGAPLLTLVSLVTEALGGPRQGVPPEWVRMVHAVLPGHAAYAVCPVFDQPVVALPDCLVPLVRVDEPVPVSLERLASVPPERLREQVAALFGDEPPESWRAVVGGPGRWLAQYVTVLAAAWRAYQPIWRRLSARRAAEAERIGTAVVRDAMDLVLAGLSPRTRFADGSVYLPDLDGSRAELGDRRLLLLPLTSGTRASVVNLDLPDTVWLGYPLPGLGALDAGQLANPPGEEPDALAALLGPVRAALLRVLRRPVTMGALARLLHAAPSTVTYHCGQLASAGLVVRRRTGREVRVVRTTRGDAVVDLLS